VKEQFIQKRYHWFDLNNEERLKENNHQNWDLKAWQQKERYAHEI
jgi:hypothetical protein